MAGDRKIRGVQVRRRVSLDEDYEVRYWVRKLGCTEQQLRDAVQKKGSSVAAVRSAVRAGR